MVPFVGWAATLFTTYLTGYGWFEGDTPRCNSDVFACWTPASELNDHPTFPGGFPTSPPRSLRKRRAKYQHGPHKRLKAPVETNWPGPPSTKTMTKEHNTIFKSPAEAFQKRSEVYLPFRIFTSAPESHTGLPTSPTPTEDDGPGAQVIRRAGTGPANLLSAVVVRSTRGQPPPLNAENVVIGRKRPAPADFDEDVPMPHRKRYITGWMPEYVRLHASSWREMLRVMQEAKWRPFRPQVICYLAPAPPSAPLYHRYTNPAPGGPLVKTPTGGLLRSPSPPLPSLGDPSPSLPFTTNLLYPPES